MQNTLYIQNLTRNRPGDPIYTYVAKRDAEPEPEAEAEPFNPRPGRGAY